MNLIKQDNMKKELIREAKRLQELAGIYKLEEDFKSIISKYIRGDYNEMYYWGGYEDKKNRNTNFPLDITAVDIIPKNKNKVWDNYIEADLNKPIKLIPKKFIFIPMGLIDDSNVFSNNISNSLKPKGMVIINEYVSFSSDLIVKLIEKYKFKIIFKNIENEYIDKYKDDEEDEYEQEGIYDPIILQKP
jgi:hypothetical protein